MSDQPKSGMGCFIKGLIGLVIVFAVIVVGGITTGYIILNHTSLPAKAIVAVLNRIPALNIEGVRGSFNSGFEVDKIRITDDNGNTHSLDDVRLKYKRDGDTFILRDVHVGRGYFYIDRSDDDANATSSSPSEGKPVFNEDGKTRIIVKKLLISNVTVEDINTGEKFHLEKIELDSLDTDDDQFRMGKFIIKSTDIDFKILPAEGAEQGDVLIVEGKINKELHDNLLAPIVIKGKIDMADPKNPTYDLSVFDGEMLVNGKGEAMNVKLRDLSLPDQFGNAPPLTEINADLNLVNGFGKAVGSLKVAGKEFKLEHGIVRKGSLVDSNLIAVREADGVTYKLSFPSSSSASRMFPLMLLVTEPEMPLDEALAMLVVGKKHDALTEAEKEEIKKLRHHFKEADESPEKQAE